jgi:O-antigen/teichoic acid export membrane protein
MLYMAGNVVSAAVPFLLLVVLTRVLAPEQYGLIVSFYMLVALCSAVAGLGLQAAVSARWLNTSAGDPRRYTGTAVAIVVLSSALTAALSSVVAPMLGVALPSGISALAAVLAGTTVLQGVRFAVWQAKGQAVRATVLQVTAAALNMGLSLLGVFSLSLGADGRIFGAVAASALVGAASIWLLWRDDEAIFEFGKDDAKALLRYGIPLVPHTLAGALLVNADRFAVSAVLDTAALGVYGTAGQLGMVIGVIADAAVKAYTPYLYRLLDRNDERDRLMVVGLAYASIPFWLLMAAVMWAAYVLLAPLLLGPKFQAASHLAIWFLLGGAVSAVYYNVAGLFFFTGKTEWISAATLTACAFAAIVAKPAVQAFGVAGGGLAFLGSQVVLLASAWLLSTRVRPMPWRSPTAALRTLRAGVAS